MTEAVAQRYSVKKVFLEILQKSLENTCARVSFLIKLQASEKLQDSNKITKQLWHWYFPWVLSCKFAAYFQNTFS